jgi:hypothetical protein
VDYYPQKETEDRITHTGPIWCINGITGNTQKHSLRANSEEGHNSGEINQTSATMAVVILNDG